MRPLLFAADWIQQGPLAAQTLPERDRQYLISHVQFNLDPSR